ncbi:phosphoesterase [Sphaerisporangium siamense]|uniref:Putative phosphodiesterase n=1 Tax=Sphaerisporangium siamense TaxID=795645 RepID=A0A7W7G8C3_9ACTN|nr:metallophosphoesterase family protein [Sphaerisporangium siamense]MBB4701618.1 putative phosphodiesterase [Sphaerisporangium siamense]GII85743.1 phosphoesterase [Sphaerisporangium siamense]
MRLAVLSDIHGVLPALEAVLAEPEVASADLIVLTGDMAAGPQPVETLDLLVSLGPRALWVNGNADRELVEARQGRPSAYPISQWAAEQLRDDQIALLAALPDRQVLDLDRLGTTLFVHATPRRDDEMILVDSTLARWSEVLADVTADTVVLGNTHMPFIRLVDRRLVINPGSVGMPYGTTGPHWALLTSTTGAATLRRTPMDPDTTATRLITESTCPDIRNWTAEYITTTYSDTEALTEFAKAEQR